MRRITNNETRHTDFPALGKAYGPGVNRVPSCQGTLPEIRVLRFVNLHLHSHSHSRSLSSRSMVSLRDSRAQYRNLHFE